MARQTRRSTTSSRPAAPQHTQTRPATTAAHPPAPVAPAPPAPMAHAPAPQQPGLFAQMASTAAGVAVGSAVGHTLGAGISGLFSGGSSAPAPEAHAPPQQYQQPQQFAQQQAQPNIACEPDQRAFMRCLDQNSNDITACQFYLDMLKQCQSAQTSTLH
ncbi:hypothetical protein HDU85_002327 [Gaertneriomyces sp. JEL0708]|nr:hypothetical protein HDU85_002327 [Gaertneriomyces sp. JEL0708]